MTVRPTRRPPRQKTPGHPQRYLARLLGIGILHGFGVAWGSTLLPWAEVMTVIFQPRFTVLFSVPAAWIVGWLLRGPISARDGTAPSLLALYASLLGAWVFGSLVCLSGGLLVVLEGDGWGLLAVVFCWFFGAWLAVGGLLLLPLALPLTWIAIRLLRRTDGGSPRPALAPE